MNRLDGWLQGWRRHLQTIIFYFFIDEKHREKSKENSNRLTVAGNFVLIGGWQPCYYVMEIVMQ